MARGKIVREEVLASMGAHVLQHGLNTASLRPLAEAAGTSDRMLIYHFGSKDALMSELLQYLAGRMAAGLGRALPAAPAPTLNAAMHRIVALLRSPDFAPFMRVWLDIVSSAAQGNAAHRAIGGLMIEGFYDWLRDRLPPGTPDPDTTVRAMMAAIEGIVVLDAVGQTDAADRAIGRLFPI